MSPGKTNNQKQRTVFIGGKAVIGDWYDRPVAAGEASSVDLAARVEPPPE
ncbi:MAG: hypothetical protein Q7S40_07685 [Opitutaceae bacterium]|nr:hypothetical protein [Opitutaceae bacterium]